MMKKLAIVLWGALFISIGGFPAWILFLSILGIAGAIWLIKVWVTESSYERVWENWRVLSDEMKERYNSRAEGGEGFALYAEEHYTWWENFWRD